jgi:hypothetical protein
MQQQDRLQVRRVAVADEQQVGGNRRDPQHDHLPATEGHDGYAGGEKPDQFDKLMGHGRVLLPARPDRPVT